MLLYLIIFPQSTFHLFFSANLWGDQSNSLVLKRRCWTAELCGIVRNKWQTGTSFPNPASNNVTKANGLLHSVQWCMTFLIKKKKSSQRTRFAWWTQGIGDLVLQFGVAEESFVCGCWRLCGCVDRLHAISSWSSLPLSSAPLLLLPLRKAEGYI